MAKKFKISGPGAADFLTAQGGLDQPAANQSTGMGQTSDEGIASDEGIVNDATQLEPDLEPPDPTKKTTL